MSVWMAEPLPVLVISHCESLTNARGSQNFSVEGGREDRKVGIGGPTCFYKH